MRNILRGRFYVKVPSYWSVYDPSRYFVCPSPDVYDYSSNEVLNRTQIERHLIWNIALFEFVVINTMYFRRCARDGIYFVNQAFDLRIKAAEQDLLGILTRFAADLKEQIILFEVFNIFASLLF